MIYQVYKTNSSHLPNHSGYGDLVGYVCLCHKQISNAHIWSRLIETAIISSSVGMSAITHSVGAARYGELPPVSVLHRPSGRIIFTLIPIEGQLEINQYKTKDIFSAYLTTASTMQYTAQTAIWHNQAHNVGNGFIIDRIQPIPVAAPQIEQLRPEWIAIDNLGVNPIAEEAHPPEPEGND